MLNESELLETYEKYAIQYRKKVCSKCSKLQMKERGCGLLKGCSKTTCMHMQRAIDNRKKMKELTKGCLSDMLKDMDTLRTNAHRNEAFNEALY